MNALQQQSSVITTTSAVQSLSILKNSLNMFCSSENLLAIFLYQYQYNSLYLSRTFYYNQLVLHLKAISIYTPTKLENQLYGNTFLQAIYPSTKTVFISGSNDTARRTTHKLIKRYDNLYSDTRGFIPIAFSSEKARLDFITCHLYSQLFYVNLKGNRHL